MFAWVVLVLVVCTCLCLLVCGSLGSSCLPCLGCLCFFFSKVIATGHRGFIPHREPAPVGELLGRGLDAIRVGQVLCVWTTRATSVFCFFPNPAILECNARLVLHTLWRPAIFWRFFAWRCYSPFRASAGGCAHDARSLTSVGLELVWENISCQGCVLPFLVRRSAREANNMHKFLDLAHAFSIFLHLCIGCKSSPSLPAYFGRALVRTGGARTATYIMRCAACDICFDHAGYIAKT